MQSQNTQQQIDVVESRALVTGTVLAMLHEYSKKPDRAVCIDNVDFVDDVQGNHLPMVRLTMRSGVKLLVIIAEDA